MTTIQMPFRSVIELVTRSIELGKTDNAIAILEGAVPQVEARVAELEAICTKLDELDWCIGYELGTANQQILDEAQKMARAALKRGGPNG